MTAPAWAGKCVGLFDRAGVPINKTWGPVGAGNAWNQAAANKILSGFVIKGTGGGVAWSKLMPTAANNSIYQGTTVANREIDQAFQVCEDYNVQNAALPLAQQGPFWTLKLRVFCGEYAPTWAKILGSGAGWAGGAGIPGDTVAEGGTGSTVGAWWETGSGSHGEAWKNFMTLLGQYVPTYTISASSPSGLAGGTNTQKLDGHPYLGEVTEAASMTKYAEPLQKDNYRTNNFTGLTNIRSIASPNNYTLAKDVAAHKIYMSHMVTAFPNTVWSFSYTPMVNLEGSGGITKSESSTELLIDWQANSSGSVWPKIVLENNSLLDAVSNGTANASTWPGHSGGGFPTFPPYVDAKGYTAMYTHMILYAPDKAQAFTDIGGLTAGSSQNFPITLQTNAMGATNNITTGQDVEQTITYAIWLGGRMVELPAGYDTPPDVPTIWAATNAIALQNYFRHYADLVANDPATGTTGPPSIVRGFIQNSKHPGKSPGFAPASGRFYTPTPAYKVTHQTFYTVFLNGLLDFTSEQLLNKKLSRTLSATALGFVTSLVKQRSVVYNISLGFTTSVKKFTNKSLQVNLGFVPILSRTVSKAFSVFLGLGVDFQARKTLFLQALSASLGFAVSTSKSISRTFPVTLGLGTNLGKLRFIRKVGSTMPPLATANGPFVSPAFALDVPRFSGDLLIARVFYDGGSGTIGVIGDGWQAVSNTDAISGAVHTQIFWKVAIGSDDPPDFTATTATFMAASLEEFANNDPNPLQLNTIATATATAGNTLTMTEGALPNHLGGVSITSMGMHTANFIQNETPGASWNSSGWYANTDVSHGGGDYRLSPPTNVADSELVTVTNAVTNWAGQIAFFNSGFGPNYFQVLTATLGFATNSSKKIVKDLRTSLGLNVNYVAHKVGSVFTQAFNVSLGMVGSVTGFRGLKAIFFNASMTAQGSIPYMVRWYTGAFKFSSEGILRAASRAKALITKNRNSN